MYLVGTVSILVTGRNQRLGDLAGGTLVVRDRRPLPAEYFASSQPRRVPAWDTSAIRPDEIDAVVTFLARRSSSHGARAQVAARARRASPSEGRRLVEESNDELFLERLVASKRSQA